MKLAQDISDFHLRRAFNTADFSIEHIKPKSTCDEKFEQIVEYSLGNLKPILKKKDKNNKQGDLQLCREARDTPQGKSSRRLLVKLA